MGALTPVGNTVEEFWSALTQGKSGIGPITKFDAQTKTASGEFQFVTRSEEHTSELQSQSNLVCRLLLEKKKKKNIRKYKVIETHRADLVVAASVRPLYVQTLL